MAIDSKSSPRFDQTKKSHAANKVTNQTIGNNNMRQFRLFTTQEANQQQSQSSNTALQSSSIMDKSASQTKRACEAMKATENLPDEPLMPRSHKSSARSFLKGIGLSNRERQSRSFLQNVSSTSKHTNSTGLNSSQLIVPQVPLTAPQSKTKLVPTPARPPVHK